MVMESFQRAIDFRFLWFREPSQKTVGCGRQRSEDAVVERKAACAERDPDSAPILHVGRSLHQARLFQPLQNLRHAARGTPELSMQLTRIECVGSTGTSQSRQHGVVARCELEGSEDILLKGVDQGAQSRQTKDGRQTRELELRIFPFPAALEIVDPVQGSPPIAGPGRG